VPEAQGALLHHGPSAPGTALAQRGHPGDRLDTHPLLDGRGRRRGGDRLHPVRGPEGRDASAPHRAPCATDTGQSAELFTTYDYHACITDRDGNLLELESDHRGYAEIENAIRDLKYGVGLNLLPSGKFAANGAWLAVQVMAHDLASWTARIGMGEGIVTTRTLRRRLFGLPGRLTRSARRVTLHLPARWPWAVGFGQALTRFRALPLA